MSPFHRFDFSGERRVRRKCGDAPCRRGPCNPEVDLDALHDPTLWLRLRFFAEVVPDGDVLPIRAAFKGSADVHSVGFGPVTSNRPMVRSGPDLVGSKIATGRVPHILRAWALVGRGRQQKTWPVRLAGERRFHPKHGDFGRRSTKRGTSSGTIPGHRGSRSSGMGWPTGFGCAPIVGSAASPGRFIFPMA